ncbi:MAG: esterase/lipase family protein [Pirellulaceae bacterium]
MTLTAATKISYSTQLAWGVSAPGSRRIFALCEKLTRVHCQLSIVLVAAVLLLGGCAWNVDTVRRVAAITDWGSSPGVDIRRRPRNPLERPMNMWSTWTGRGGVQPGNRAQLFLRTHALEDEFRHNPDRLLSEMRQATLHQPDPEKLHVLSELAYVLGDRERLSGNERRAGQLLATAVAASYQYLFDPRLDSQRNVYDPVFRRVCDTYNAALEGMLRIMRDTDALRPGGMFVASTLDGHPLEIAISIDGRWRHEEFEKFEFASDFDAEGLQNVYHTYGLGVPLIGVRRRSETSERPDEEFYPQGLTLPLTAFITTAIETDVNEQGQRSVIRMIDPLEQTEIQVADRFAPLESDISTPLAYFLDDPLLGNNWFSTAALLNGDFARQFGGLYMLEPYDPTKIPVVMVHGFWSSPMTWTEMFNDLRADRTIRSNYQFWFYLYPSGQPFWFSARQMREDLAGARQQLDPQGQSGALNEMVLVGHSMGGLISRLQTINSRDNFWELVSERDVNELQGDTDTRQRVRDTLYFDANPAIARVITIGTPHRGSNVSNSLTRWLSQRLFMLPSNLTNEYGRIVKQNPDFFRSDMLEITTSTDSLSPRSTFFDAMLQAETSDRVRYHNIIGVYKSSGPASWISSSEEISDGVVSVESAQAEDTESELHVPSEHSSVHQHPLAVLEVKRILREHLQEVHQASSEPATRDYEVVPASLTEPEPQQWPETPDPR